MATTTDAGSRLAAPDPDSTRSRLEAVCTVSDADPHLLIDCLHRHSGLSRQQLKDATLKGAVLLRRGATARRVRRAKTALRSGDRLELHYDRALLALQPPVARCVADQGVYSVWCKPAGLLVQGNEFGDHCALTRQAEQAWALRRRRVEFTLAPGEIGF